MASNRHNNAPLSDIKYVRNH